LEEGEEAGERKEEGEENGGESEGEGLSRCQEGGLGVEHERSLQAEEVVGGGVGGRRGPGDVMWHAAGIT
jgi:hypothetical protein